MKIVRIEDFHVNGGWDPWSFLKITTDDGLVGWSEFNEARNRRGLTFVVRGMAEHLIGEDPRAVERIGAKLYATTRTTSGGLQSLAVAAFVNACLDIKGKALGIPVYELLGGPLRNRIPVYWSHCGLHRARFPQFFTEAQDDFPVHTLDDIRRMGKLVADRGFKALKTNLIAFDPTGNGKAVHQRGSGPFELHLEPPLIDAIVAQLAAFREGAGSGVRLMMDLNYNYKTEGFRQIAKAVEPFKMMWLEIDMVDARALATIRQSSATPIGSLEIILGRRALKPFLENQSVDVAIVDAVFNGVPEAIKMANMIDAYEINVAAHNSHGPLGSLISAHFCASIANFRVMEIDVDAVPWRRHLLTAPEVIEAGEYVLPTGPGWGADLNEEVAREHALVR